jgi:hypothetical protein
MQVRDVGTRRHSNQELLEANDRSWKTRMRKLGVKVVCEIAGTDGGACDRAGTDVIFERTGERGAAFLLYGAGTNGCLVVCARDFARKVTDNVWRTPK